MPIFTNLHQDSVNQAETGSLIGEDPDNSGPAANFLADTFKHVDSSDAPVVTDWERKMVNPSGTFSSS